MYTINCIEKTKINKKEAGNVPFFKKKHIFGFLSTLGELKSFALSDPSLSLGTQPGIVPIVRALEEVTLATL